MLSHNGNSPSLSLKRTGSSLYNLETAAKEAFLPEDSIRCSWRQALVKRKALEIADSAQEIAIRPRECGQPGGCRRNATHPWHPQILLFQLLDSFSLNLKMPGQCHPKGTSLLGQRTKAIYIFKNFFKYPPSPIQSFWLSSFA